MPVIDIHGEKKKVACGPCIRGHRSSKCQHSDRVLMEVRKPGRPLSACPHPSGSCSCQRAVYYTVPKPEPSSLLSPITASSPARVQKPKQKKALTNFTPSIVQRAFDDSLTVLAQRSNQSNDATYPAQSSETSSSAPSLPSSSSSTPQTQAIDVAMQLPITDEGFHNERPSPLKLVNLGLDENRTASIDPGRSGAWAGYHTLPITQDPLASPKAPLASCCAPSSAPLVQKAKAKSSGSCCAPKAPRPLAQQTALTPDPFEAGSNSVTPGTFMSVARPLEVYENQQMDAFRHPFSHSPDLFGQMFTQSEDEFGCTHQPDHSCQCGDGCECLGCSTHPANRTTTDYVRYHTEWTLRGNTDPNQLQHMSPHYRSNAPDLNGQTNQAFRTVDPSSMLSHMAQFATSDYMPQHNFTSHWQTHPIANVETNPPHFHLNSDPLAGLYSNSDLYNFDTPQPSQGQPQDVKSMAPSTHLHDPGTWDHDSPSTEDDTSTLSPSAFSVQQFSIPGCNDLTGSCLCGDGCQCEGCLTHNGHENGNVSDISGQILDSQQHPLSSSALTLTRSVLDERSLRFFHNHEME